jgi:hypothetical protein
MVHLEVPQRYEDMDLWGRIRGELEIHYNNEPFWRGAQMSNFADYAKAAGFREVQDGYQDATTKADPAVKSFTETSKGVHRCWYMVSGIK